MALDGIYLNLLKQEISLAALGGRVEKIHMPGKNEIVLSMRTRSAAFRLFLSCSGNAPRVNITQYAPENPMNPPMLCMLFRKHLTGAVLEEITQSGIDRVLFLKFNASNEIGDRVSRTIVLEIMAQHSNIILLDDNNVILDSVRRVDSLHSSVREVLPGRTYELPPAQNKLNLLDCDIDIIIENIKRNTGELVSSAILKTIQGLSPIVCRELSFRSYGEDIVNSENTDFSHLKNNLSQMKKEIEEGITDPCIVISNDERMLDFSFTEIMQYENAARLEKFSSLSLLLDNFYYEKERAERTKSRAADLFRFLNTTIERTAKKINNLKADLEKSENREEKKIFAELIQANMYSLEKGSLFYTLENYYDNNKKVKIPAKPHLTPVQNAQVYYKEYRKAATAEAILKEQIKIAQENLEYLQSVLDELSRSSGENEISEIRSELENEGFLKKKSSKKEKKQAPLDPLEFVSSDGFRVLVGRNNIGNEKLTFKIAAKNDMWFHAQKMPGSHAVLLCENKVPSDAAIEYAASLAAFYSSGRQSSRVTVDYTEVKNLKKPSGSRPGFVIYHEYYSIISKPLEK